MKSFALFRLTRLAAMMIRTATSSLVMIVAVSTLHAEETNLSDLPIKRVVMYSSGVAFFEHAGEVEGNSAVELQFNVKDINDLLKSMVLEDLGGGRISTVSYGSKDPITRTLSTFSIDLTRNPTLADLLGQIRGEAIEIDAPTKVAGTIIGVEKRIVAVGKEDTIEQSYLTLLTDEGLRSVSLDNVGRIKLTNAKLDAELRQALLVLASGKSQEKKLVSLNFLGAGKRAVRVGYIQEAPIWKTSYRLVLDNDKQPLLQGWAIVENTTEADWNDVNLTLVSGRPISFVMDLYQPLYLARPEVKPELYASLRPRTYDQSLKDAEQDFAMLGEQMEAGKQDGLARSRELRKNLAAAAPSAPPAPGFASPSSGYDRATLKSSLESVANASDVGEMFRYAIATPVKLSRSTSAMLPIVNDSVEGSKVSIYNEASHIKHPLSGLRLKNSTDLHLMQGPITVFDDGAYAGDAQIQDLQPGTERLISYAMDLDTEVAPSLTNSPQSLVSIRLAKGVLFVSTKLERKKSYVIKNSGKREKTVLIEYPVVANWKLLEPAEPSEKTRDLYRFAVKAEPGKAATLVVHEEQQLTEQLAANNLNNNQVQIYLQATVVSAEVKKALQEIVARKDSIQKAVQKRAELDRQVVVIDQEQKRIRDNMAQLPKESDLFRRYITKFTEQEDEIERLRGLITAAIDEETKLRSALDQYLLGIDIK